ncbi:efflux RND transporter periplasmic adaptor subunit [Aporhodopirellula aestuarii]|uniref:Efflux RND transporter periplasmic adaptor subunit n=1 Tax=Aporhodopirellula aestuarii TaxID=2950107 RepID=A0ABT0U7C3_9BACT|nr:efflux RND transporter periplasmic adaptor subunit [Aporhodopirellula aestuarii]MCM2372830.1 efflux RND transporter periplasmic adaptor subunit [Aporhodopirellula aestuarii]
MQTLNQTTVELNQQRLRIAPDVRVWPVRERGETVYRIEIRGLHRFFRIGYRESYLCSLLDGKTTLAQACSIAAAKLGRDAPTETETAEIARWLLNNEIAYLDENRPPVRDPRRETPAKAATTPPSAWKLLARFNPFWIKVPLPGGERVVAVLSRWMAPLLSAPMVFAGMLLILSALIGIGVHRESFLRQSENIFHPTQWAWMLGIWIVLKLIHEFGHAIACYRLGGEVNRCGVVFVLMAPLAYVDVSSCWRMPSRVSRIGVSAAGMFVEGCIAAVAAWVFLIVDEPLVRNISHTTVLTAGLSTLLFNANVLMRFDGYFILADAVDIPNLAAEASTTLKRLARRWIAGEATTQGQVNGWRGILVGVYGIAALFWKVSVCICLAITASTLFEGGGILITMIGIAIWVGVPVFNAIRYLAALREEDLLRFYQAILLGGGVCSLVIASVFIIPIPSRVRAPVITRFAASANVRAPASGFIDSLHIGDGDRVAVGDRLITLRNEELQCQLRELELESEQLELEQRRATGEQDEGKRHVLRRRAESLQTQLDQVRGRMESLTIRSTNTGRVIARGLESTIGTYVEEGDELMVVAGPRDSEWIALIAPRQIERVRDCIGQNVRVVSVGQAQFDSKLQRIEPRATDRLIEPALASIHGGPLPTRSESDATDASELRLLQPHFYAWLDVADGENRLPVGVRLFADCGYRTQTIAGRLREWIRSLYEASQKSNAEKST